MSEATMEKEPAVQDVFEVAEQSTAIAAFSPLRQQFAQLKEKFGNVVLDLSTKAGEVEARKLRRDFVELCVRIEDRRVAAKKPHLDEGRKIDAMAKEFLAEAVAMKDPIDAQIKALDAKREAEKQAKVKAEQDRVDAIRNRIGQITVMATRAGHSSDEIKHTVKLVEAVTIDAKFEEFQEEAERHKSRVLADLADMLSIAESREQQERAAVEARKAEQARLQTEREELTRLRAEQEKRDAEARAKREQDARIESDRLAAERAKQEAELAAQRKADELERARLAKIESDRLAEAKRVEDARIAADRAKFAEEQRIAREARDAQQAAFQEEQRIARAEQQAERERLQAQQAEIIRRELEEQAKRDEEEIARHVAIELMRNAAASLLGACRAVVADPAFENLTDLTRETVELAITEATEEPQP